MENHFYYRLENISPKQQKLLWGETVFHNANGYIGVRGNFEEGYPASFTSIRGQYINAFYDITDMKQAEALCGLVEEKQTMLNVADTQSVRIELGEEAFSLFEGTVKAAERWVDMKTGVTGRRVDWVSPQGQELTFTFRRMTSFVRLSLFLQEITVASHNYEGPVRFLSGHKGEVRNFCDPSDPRVAGESPQYLFAKEVKQRKGRTFITAKTSRSGLKAVSGVGHRIPEGYHTEIRLQEREAQHVITGRISPGEEVCLYKYSWFSDSIRESAPEIAAMDGLDGVMEVPAEKLYDEQEQYLAGFWEAGLLEIEGDEDLNLAVHYNMYALLQSAGRDCHGNMAAKGLSGEGYEGHFFWDTEMYAMPSFLMIQPKIAETLLSFRYETLDKARENARKLGHKKGALYPWRTINGEECSGYFPSGTAAYHISGDVAYAVTAYYLATNDREFLYRKGAEMLMETARLWVDTGSFAEGKFQIQDVTGPDEYTCMVNNNYYTNALAKYNLEWAVKCAALLKEAGEWDALCEKIHLEQEEVEQFERAAACMYLPYDEALDINPQDDSFLQKKRWDFANTPKENYPLLLHYHPLALYRRQVCKQADTVLAHFILEDYQKLSTIRNSFLYYEGVTTHDSSLSTCVFCIMAAKLGMVEKAVEYFGESAKLDLFNTHKNTKDGIHTANMAGNYMAITYGFAGLRIKESGLYLSPCIPARWKSYRFRFSWQGTRMEVTVDRKECRVRRLEGRPVTLHLCGEELLLEDCVRTRVRKEGEGEENKNHEV